MSWSIRTSFSICCSPGNPGEGGGPEAIAILRKLRLITRVLTVNEKIIDLALASTFTDFEDAIQYFAAAEWELDAIVTRNRRDYKASKIAIVNAEECLELASL